MWKKCFYRTVDSLQGDEGEELRRIEENMFYQIVKQEVEEENGGSWFGSAHQHRIADMKISGYFKSSFKVYEKNKDERETQYFVF